jgi:two-component system chemotaxis response regulator CheB
MIVLGASSGGFKALQSILRALPKTFPLPLGVVLHRHKESDNLLEISLQRECALPVMEVVDKVAIQAGRVYVAPPDYHLLAEATHFSLSTDELVQYARPSIDVLFESAAQVFGKNVIGVVLTGASQDGARGAAEIVKHGGKVIVQDPATAECPTMPGAALASTRTSFVLPLDQIAAALIRTTECNAT